MPMKDWFINPQEQRLRMGWRVLVQVLLMIAIALPLSLIFAAVYSGSPAGKSGMEPMQALNASEGLLTLNEIFTLIAILGGVGLAAKFLDHQRVREYGFRTDRKWWGELRFGLLLGAGLMGLLFLVEWATGWVTITGGFYVKGNWPFLPALLFPVIQSVAAGVGEEVLIRGYYLTNFAQGFRHWLGARGAGVAGLILSSGIFGGLHAMNPHATLLSVINITAAGIFLLGFGYLVTGSLALPIGVHIAWNFFQGSVFGFPVSGTSMNNVTLLTLQQHGNPLVTGGSFGPEGGLLGLCFMILAPLCVFWREAARKETVAVQSSIAAYRPPE